MKTPKLNCLLILCFIFAFTRNSEAQPYPRGLSFDDSSYTLVPKIARRTRALDTIPSQFSLKDYTPYPKYQGEHYLTCTAWACAYCARTMVDAIKYNWTDRDSITAKAYSPAFLFRLVNPNDNSCSMQTDMELTLQMLKSKGCVSYADLPDQCAGLISPGLIGKAMNSKINGFMRLFDVRSPDNIKVQVIKRALYEKKPVVIGMLCPPSFDHAYHNWQPTEDPKSVLTGHAMCVVGYDDNQFGGAFEVQNSWGENWGFEGYTWINYNDFSHFVKYAYEFIDLPDVKPGLADLSGSIKLVLSTGGEMNTKLLVSEPGLNVTNADKTQGPLAVYETTGSFLSGTTFRIYISNNEPAFVYAIGSDLGNHITKLFPYEDNISAALTYKKNDVAIPDEKDYIQFDNNPGTDFLCVLYSRKELNLNNIVAELGSAPGSFNEKVFKVAGGQMVAPSNIKFNNNRIAFQAFSQGKDIVAIMVEMNHK